jgi:thiamine-phosphate pyrophosphorylase
MAVLTARRPVLCFITNRRMYARGERASQDRLLDAVAAAAHAGVDLIQIRERDLDDRALVALVREAIARVEGTGALVLVNDRLDIALAAGADGVHLRSDSPPARRVREIAASLVIGRSVHAVAEALDEAPASTSATVAAGRCDYLIAGTVFPTPSKPEGHLLGVAGLRDLCAAVALPVLAVGGMSVQRSFDVARVGAAGIAAIRLFADPATVEETVTRVRRSFYTPSEVV